MDPDVTYEAVNDLSLDLEERAVAALDLLSWLAKGGYSPGDSGAAVVADVCRVIIIGYQESIMHTWYPPEPL